MAVALHHETGSWQKDALHCHRHYATRSQLISTPESWCSRGGSVAWPLWTAALREQHANSGYYPHSKYGILQQAEPHTSCSNNSSIGKLLWQWEQGHPVCFVWSLRARLLVISKHLQEPSCIRMHAVPASLYSSTAPPFWTLQLCKLTINSYSEDVDLFCWPEPAIPYAGQAQTTEIVLDSICKSVLLLPETLPYPTKSQQLHNHSSHRLC